jgi:hypothetical protein
MFESMAGTTGAAVALIAAGIALAAALTFGARLLLFTHRTRVGVEKTSGHLKLRRRMANLAGRRQDTYETVVRAETMYGWVWISATRRSRTQFREVMGWAPTRRTAYRALRRLQKGRPAL